MERLRGFRDFYPEPVPNAEVWSCAARQFIFSRWRKTAAVYGFQEYDGPPLEPLELFTAKSGDEIVGQLYNFTDKGDRAVALRPEMTPTLARMVSAHERNYRKPIKWFSIPQLFRYERQQKGRLREHFQLNVDIFGDPSPAADAELIALLIDSLRGFGLGCEDFVIRLSSRTAWEQFFQARCADPSRAYAFFQVIDKLEREDPAQSDEKLKSFGTHLEEVKAFIHAAKPSPELEEVLRNLQSRDLEQFVQIDYNIIRGLAYYTGVVFEAFSRKGEFRAIAGGGRYDNLVKLISGGKVELPALGFGMGDVVLLEMLKEFGKVPSLSPAIDLFFIIETEELRAESLKWIQRLREAGVSVDYVWGAMKGEKQFKKAMECGARHTARLEAEGGQLRVRLKNLAQRTEELLPPIGLMERFQAAAPKGDQ